jgi:hypothetical protein
MDRKDAIIVWLLFALTGLWMMVTTLRIDDLRDRVEGLEEITQ